MSEMSGLENILRCPHVAMRLIELSHDPLSSGYVYDSVPPGRAVMECDIKSPCVHTVVYLLSHFCPGIQQGFIPLSVHSADMSELHEY